MSTRVPEELKVDFMSKIDVEQKTFSKWLRNKMEIFVNNENREFYFQMENLMEQLKGASKKKDRENLIIIMRKKLTESFGRHND